MNATRSKKIRFASKLILSDPVLKEQVDRASRDKLEMPNRYGKPQHKVINPARQCRNMIRRTGIA